MAEERRALRKGEAQTYPVEMRAGEFLRATATQESVDVALVLRDAGGKTLATVNRSIAEGLEELYWIAETGGRYELAVNGAARAGAEGFYRLTTEVRPAEARERSCFRGFLAMEEARKLTGTLRAENRRKSVPLFEEALAEFVQCGSKGWEAQVLEEMSDTLMYMGERGKPLGLYKRGSVLRRELGEERALAISLTDMGIAATDVGEVKDAVAWFEEALRIKEKFGDMHTLAMTLSSSAPAYRYLGDQDKAISALEKALRLLRLEGKSVTMANVLARLGSDIFATGRYQEGIALLAESLQLAEELNNPDLKGSATGTLGMFYSALGDMERARQYWADAGKHFGAAGNRSAVASSWHNRAMLDVRQEQYESALTTFQMALKQREEVGARTAIGNSHVSICEVLAEMGRLGEAREHGEQGLKLGTEQKFTALLATSNRCLGRVSLKAGNLEKAREYALAARRWHREGGDLRGAQAVDLALLAEVERAAGRWPEALAYIEESTRMADAERAGLANPGLRATILAERSERISLHTDTLMRMEGLDPESGYAERAFGLTELWRARNLVETLSGTAARATLRPEQVKEERALLDRVTGLQRELFRPGLAAGRRGALKAELTKAERELELFQALTDGTGKAVESKVSVESLRKQVGAKTVLVEYALGRERSYAFVLGADGLQWFALAPRKEIEPLVESYRRRLGEKVSTLTAAASLRRVDSDGAALYRMLLGPLEGVLAGKSKVVIVADGRLHYLPFEALPSGKGRVVERWTVSYAPSAMALASLQERSGQRAAPGKTLLAIGDAVYGGKPTSRERGVEFQNLPQTRAEVLGLRELYPAGATQIYLGAEATEAQLKKADIGAYRYLHFAAHGYYDEEEPRRSGIVLGTEGMEDGILQAFEISRMRLNADMVTLSACQTGLGKLLAGEGVMGLTRAFFAAGAQSVVASLWNVNDSATAELMKEFYRNMNRGMGRDRALREAKLAMMRTPGTAWQHPYFWATFVLLGDAGAGR